MSVDGGFMLEAGPWPALEMLVLLVSIVGCLLICWPAEVETGDWEDC